MKINKKYFSIALIFILLTVSLGSYSILNSKMRDYENTNPHLAKTTHSPIQIDGDLELASFPDKSGSGTNESPYVIDNFIIDGNYDTTPINISDIDTYYLVIRDCELIKGPSDGAGIYIEDCSNIKIKNVEIHNCLGSGIKIYESLGLIDNIIIENNTIVDNEEDGIDLWEFSGEITINSNNISSNTYSGISDLGGDNGNATINNNIINYNGDEGIDWSHSSSNIYKNKIKGNGEGIVIYANNINISQNNITENEGDGIDIFNGDNCIILNNYITENEGDGIDICDGSYNDIIDNEIMGNGQFGEYGIRIEETSSLRNNITHNLIAGNDGGMIDDGGTETIIENNYEDSDGDGFNDWEEIQQGTDRFDENDYPSNGNDGGGSNGNDGGGEIPTYPLMIIIPLTVISIISLVAYYQRKTNF